MFCEEPDAMDFFDKEMDHPKAFDPTCVNLEPLTFGYDITQPIQWPHHFMATVNTA
jgi:hypothetical protein